MIALLAACTTLHTVEGAKTLEPGQWQFATAGSVQGRQNGISTALGVPIGQGEVGFRYGLVPDVDIGTRVYIGGLYTDVRYRFLERGEWDLAVAPGIGGFVIPDPTRPTGTLDLRTPVRAQRPLGPRWDASMGVTPMARNGLGTFDLLLGANARLEFHTPRFFLGLGGDVYAQPTYGFQPAWVAGLDMGLRTRSRAER